MSLILTEELARKIEQSEIELLESRLTGVQKIEGNPMGVEIKKFGDAVAFYVKNIPGPSFNNVKGISRDQLDEIDAILDFYHERGLSANFEITPAHCSAELFQLLSERGYFQRGFRTALYGPVTDDILLNTEEDSSISIHEFEDDEFAIFGQIYTKGFNMPSSLIDFVAQNNQVLHHNKHWTFYLARVKGEPAGIGVLFEQDGIATLAASATTPEYRNKGVHSALVKKRLQQAQQNHCHMIVGQTGYGSGSLRNMERAGMKVAYTKAIWTKL